MMIRIQERYPVVAAAAEGNDPHPRVAATTKAAAAAAATAQLKFCSVTNTTIS